MRSSVLGSLFTAGSGADQRRFAIAPHRVGTITRLVPRGGFHCVPSPFWFDTPSRRVLESAEHSVPRHQLSV